jgi:hypothetical protein
MKRLELEAIYQEAWSIYYTPEHIETLLRRAIVTNIPLLSFIKVLVQFTTMMQVEKVHPLQSGLFRLKHIAERRPGLPPESVLAFYPPLVAMVELSRPLIPPLCPPPPGAQQRLVAFNDKHGPSFRPCRQTASFEWTQSAITPPCLVDPAVLLLTLPRQCPAARTLHRLLPGIVLETPHRQLPRYARLMLRRYHGFDLAFLQPRVVARVGVTGVSRQHFRRSAGVLFDPVHLRQELRAFVLLAGRHRHVDYHPRLVVHRRVLLV